MRKTVFKILMLFAGLYLVQQTYAQQLLTGQIFSKSGEGIPGVQILIDGTINGTITDLNGVFNIEVYFGDVLLISRAGIETQIIEVTDHNFQQLSCQREVLYSKKKRKINKLIPKYYKAQKKHYFSKNNENKHLRKDDLMHVNE